MCGRQRALDLVWFVEEAMAAKKEYRISRSDQIRALATPARQEIIDALLSSGPGSAKDIAGALGRPADSLYYHIRKLKRVGLLIEAESRRRGKRDETVFDVPGRPMRIDCDLGNRKVADGIVDALGAMLRITQRDFGEAVAHGAAVVDGPYRALWGGRVKGWISKAQLKEINQHLQEICKIVLFPRSRAGRDLHSLSFVLTPLEPNPRDEKRR
jgi:DNA-binding transcriptional ArsR family regulator